MMYCGSCGNKNPDDAEYCMKCGAGTSDTPQVNEPPAAQNTPSGGQASKGLKDAILLLVFLILLGVVVLGALTCGGCLAAFS